MIVTVSRGADPAAVRSALASLGLWTTEFRGALSSRLFLVGAHSGAVDPDAVRGIPGVEDVSLAPSRHPLVDGHGARVSVGTLTIGEDAPPVVMAGPCSVESPEQIHGLAARLAAMGVRVLRGGAYKPRTSPYDFQGVGPEALGWLVEAARAHGLLVVTEALSEASLDAVAPVADIVQIGSRSMHMASLLRAAGAAGRPVLLKRGMAATVDEWLSAGEYCLAAGAPGVIFCERGIRGFDESTRNLLDLAAVALLAHVHKLPVVVDPSHALGRRDLIPPLARAALAAGAHGLLIEVHPEPGCARSDGPQALTPAELETLLAGCDREGAPRRTR